jgi:arylformamidase
MARLIDLSHPIKKHWHWMAASTRLRDHAEGDIFRHTMMVMNMHSFTHVDAPGHFVPGEATMESVPLDLYSGEAALIDLTYVAEEQAITAADLERQGGHVRAGDIAVLRTDWPRRHDVGSMDFVALAPYVTDDACHWLRERGVKAVGSDFPNDYLIRFEVTDRRRVRRKEENTTHEHLLAHGIGLIEYLTNLHEISKPRVQLYALPLKIVGSDGSPVRAIAVEE